MSRPVVGIVAARHQVPRPWGLLPVQGVPEPFPVAVRAAGGLPVVLPLLPGDPTACLDAVDGLLLAGGGDLHPATYGAQGTAEDADRGRDDVEVALAGAALARGVPVLGVCRGAQVLNVARGGTLHRHVEHHVLPGAQHLVRASRGSLTGELLGAVAEVNSLHHQAVARVGAGVVPTAWAGDGVVEALEVRRGAEVVALGVQWHPELQRGAVERALFGWLVGRAACAAARREPVRSPAP